MLKDYDYYLDEMKQIFENAFLDAYKNIKGKHKQDICKYVSDIYRKWYYSVLQDGTFLSPANIIDKLKQVYNIDPMIYDNISIEISGAKKINFIYERQNYSPGNYPVIEDLKLFLQHCNPYVELTEHGEVTGEMRGIVNQKLSVKNDNYYVNYLLNVSIELALVEPVTSIYLKAVKPTKKSKSFFNNAHNKIFAKIVDATISIFANFLESTLLSGEPTREFVSAIIKRPVSVDEIYKRLYSLNGIDLNSFYEGALDEDSDFPPEIREYIGLGVYYLGVGIDKYFLTTFGYYLKLISPLHIMPAKISEDMAILYNSIRENMDIDSEVYSPCSHYFLTPAGHAFFGVKNQPDSYGDIVIGDDEDICDIIGSLSLGGESKPDSGLVSAGALPQDNITVYQFKIALISDKRFWLTIEVPSDTTLSELHYQICYSLDFIITSDYCFYAGLEESPFKQYTPELNKKRTKKTETAQITDLNLEENDVLKYVIENCSSFFFNGFKEKLIKFEIKLLKVKENEYAPLYPRIYRKSKRVAEYLENNDLNF